MNLLRTIVWLLTAFWLTFAVAAESDDDEKEGGILGTGIVGTITGLGSIVVNGQHIEFDPSLTIGDGLTATTAGALVPGHTVAVVAHKDDGNWRAASIRQVLPLVGPATIGPDGRLRVLGTQVVPPSGQTPPADGDWIAVSGLWKDRQVVASRLESLPSSATARIEGSILEQTANEPLVVGETRIVGIVPQHVETGDVVRAFGTAGQDVFEANRLEAGLFVDSPSIVLAEGYLSPPGPTGLYTLLGSNLVAFTENPTMIDSAIRLFACGRSGEIDMTVPTEATETDASVVETLDCVE